MFKSIRGFTVANFIERNCEQNLINFSNNTTKKKRARSRTCGNSILPQPGAAMTAHS